MTPKEKAMHIFNKMCNSVDELLPLDVKECALIAVDEIIEELSYMWLHYAQFEEQLDERESYYEEVKQELEKL
jgi:hypothetical protein